MVISDEGPDGIGECCGSVFLDEEVTYLYDTE